MAKKSDYETMPLRGHPLTAPLGPGHPSSAVGIPKIKPGLGWSPAFELARTSPVVRLEDVPRIKAAAEKAARKKAAAKKAARKKMGGK